ncbi:MAG: branched-chain amino acid ABC transporter substrate-binding protein [Acidimicrobiales bacterium]
MTTAMALVLAACGSDDNPEVAGGPDDAATTVTIAFMGPLTGDAANLGVNIREGIKLAVDQANAAGDGVTIAVKDFDTAGDPTQAGTVKDQVIGDSSVVAVVGPAFSGETKAVIPAFEAAGLPMISPSATNVDLPNVVPNSKVFHRVIADDALQAAGIAAYLTSTVKPAKVAYVHDNSEYGKGLTEDLEKRVAASGIATALVETVDPDSEDFSSTVNKVNAANPDVIFYGGYYAEAGRFKKQLADAGSKAIFVSGDGALDEGFVTAAGAASAEGARLSCPCNLAFATSEGKLKKFYDEYKAGIGGEPGLYAPEGFDAANVLIQGIKAGHRDRASLLNYLETGFTTYEGVSKTVEFTANGNVTSKDFFVFEVKDGKLAPLETVAVG